MQNVLFNEILHIFDHSTYGYVHTRSQKSFNDEEAVPVIDLAESETTTNKHAQFLGQNPINKPSARHNKWIRHWYDRVSLWSDTHVVGDLK